MSQILKNLENLKEEKRGTHLSSVPNPIETLPTKKKFAVEKKHLLIFVPVIAALLTYSIVKIVQIKKAATLAETEVALAPHIPTLAEINTEILKSIRMKDFVSAERYITSLPKTIDREQVEFLSNYGVILRNTQKTKDALKRYEEALNLDKTNSTLYNNRAVAYLAIGENDLAIKDLLTAIEAKPDYSEALLNLGIAYEKSHKWNLAYNAYLKFMSSPDSKAGTNEMLRKRIIRMAPMIHYETKGIK